MFLLKKSQRLLQKCVRASKNALASHARIDSGSQLHGSYQRWVNARDLGIVLQSEADYGADRSDVSGHLSFCRVSQKHFAELVLQRNNIGEVSNNGSGRVSELLSPAAPKNKAFFAARLSKTADKQFRSKFLQSISLSCQRSVIESEASLSNPRRTFLRLLRKVYCAPVTGLRKAYVH